MLEIGMFVAPILGFWYIMNFPVFPTRRSHP